MVTQSIAIVLVIIATSTVIIITNIIVITITIITTDGSWPPFVLRGSKSYFRAIKLLMKRRDSGH